MVNIFETIDGSYRLFKNRDALSPHYVPSHLPFREDEIRELSRHIAPVLMGRKPQNIFIYGKTGTGKTAVTKKVLSDLNEYAQGRGLNVIGLYVNGRREGSEHRVLVKLVRLMDPTQELIGYSTAYVHDKLIDIVDGGGWKLVVAIDEIDTVKRVEELVYRLNRSNDEMEKGSISIIGISNNPNFKDKLDARTRSTLCEVEMVFKPYNAEQLEVILKERAKEAFHEGVVTEDAIKLAAAIAAKHSGDARYALQLLLNAGDLAEADGSEKVTKEHVEKARSLVEEEIVYEMVATLPDQMKLLLLALGMLYIKGRGINSFSGENVVTSGLLYSFYRTLASEYGLRPVSDRWFREYLNELETYGIIGLVASGRGMRGNTRIVELRVDPRRLVEVIRKSFKGWA